MLWPKIADYVEDTIIEANLEENETIFWQATIKATTLTEIHGGSSIAEKAYPILTTFASQFLPHCATKAIPIQLREIREANGVIEAVRNEINQLHYAYLNRITPSDEQQAIELENRFRPFNFFIPKIYSPQPGENAEFVRQREVDITLNILSIILAASPNLDQANLNGLFNYLYYRRGVPFNQNSSPVTYAAYFEFKTFEKDMDSRFNVLAAMIVKVLRVELGYDNLDDRDTLANQKFENPGLLLMSRFQQMFRKIEKGIIKDVKKSEDIIPIMKRLSDKIITEEYDSNFRSGMWNDKIATKPRTGVTDNMPVVTIARVSYLRRISAQSNDYNSDTSSREITGLQGGAVCISETPEGKRCGNVEHLAYAAFITNESFDRETLAYKLYTLKTSRRYDIEGINLDPSAVQQSAIRVSEDIKQKLANGAQPSHNDIIKNQILTQLQQPEDGKLSIIQTTRNELNGLASIGLISNVKRIPAKTVPPALPDKSQVRDTPLYLNGKFIGFVEGLSFRQLLINMRRYGTIHPHTGIHYSQKVMKGVGLVRDLRIDTTGGRIIQPLIVAEDPIKTVNFLYNLINEDPSISNRTIEDFIAEGLIEFVDSAEFEFLDVALSVDIYLQSIQEGLPERYDHIMLNPAFLLGAAANVMPFAGNNPVVRNSYFTAMVKQPITVPSSAYMERNTEDFARLHDPQVPLIKTKMYEQLLQDDPFGVNVKVLVTPHSSGEEDGIVINQRFLDMGGLSSTKYKVFRMAVEEGRELDFGEAFIENLRTKGLDPDRYGRGVIRVKKRIVKTVRNVDGTERKLFVEVPVRVMPKDILARKTWVIGENKGSSDLIFDSLREGIVDRIIWNEGKDRTKILSVIIRWSDNIDMGDKIASRFSQKGIAALVVANEDMPHDENGNTPDILLNPQGLPSRMTIGQMMELLVTEAYILPDKNKNIWSVYRNQGLDVFAPLERIFIVDKHKWDKYKFDNSGENRGPATYDNSKPSVQTSDNKSCEINQQGQFVSNSDSKKQVSILQQPSNSQSMGLTSNLEELAARFTAKQTIQQPIVSSKPEKKAEYIVITSDEVYDQESMTFLKENDITTSIEGFAGGLWAISFYKGLHPDGSLGGTTNKSYILVFGRPEDLDNIRTVVPVSWAKNVSNSFVVQEGQIEDIPGMFFDLQTDIDDEKVNPLRGIRISNIPDDKIKPITGVTGDSLREVYIRGNFKTPIADQFIADYRKEFFQVGNLIFFSFDFTIPSEIQFISKFVLVNSEEVNNPIIQSFPKGLVKQDDLDKIKDKFLVTIEDDVYVFDISGKLLMILNRRTGKKTNDPDKALGRQILDQLSHQTIPFPAGVTKYSDLAKIRAKFLIRERLFVRDKDGEVVFENDQNGQRTPVTETVYNAKSAQTVWQSNFGITIIPRENIIKLPERAVDIYIRRKERLNALRDATIFKVDVDINDAMKELELMGYNRDGSRTFYNPRTGKKIKGEIVTGYSYYMALGHKVKDKLQGRGRGGINQLTRQPNSGRTREGGLRFNLMDALACIKSGASAFVGDRLLDASGKTEIFVCTTCGMDCYQKVKDPNKSIVCPLCKDEAKAVKISLPYVTLLDRNLLMGAGVRLKMNISQPSENEDGN
jgi:DNA-directed RNA polymerase beta subunit